MSAIPVLPNPAYARMPCRMTGLEHLHLSAESELICALREIARLRRELDVAHGVADALARRP